MVKTNIPQSTDPCVFPGGKLPAGVTMGREVTWRQCEIDKKAFVINPMQKKSE